MKLLKLHKLSPCTVRCWFARRIVVATAAATATSLLHSTWWQGPVNGGMSRELLASRPVECERGVANFRAPDGSREL